MLRLLLVAGLGAALVAVGIAYAATPYDLTTSGSTATINGAIFEAFNPDDVAGSGLFIPFVRISSPNSVIHGYNTDYRPLQFEENDSATFTLARLLSEIPQFFVNGSLYREFQLDINQDLTSDDYLVSLDELELYESAFSDLCGYPFDGSGGGHSGCTTKNTATLIWDMDALEDNFVILDYRNNEGIGKRDMKILVPNSVFNQDPNCDYSAVGCTVYLTIYSQLGGDSTCIKAGSDTCPNNDGYEEWGVRDVSPTAITLQNITARVDTQEVISLIALFMVLILSITSFFLLHRRRRMYS